MNFENAYGIVYSLKLSKRIVSEMILAYDYVKMET